MIMNYVVKFKYFKLVSLLVICLTNTNDGFSQNLNIVKGLMDKLFFYIPVQAEKYDVRKTLHMNSANFSEVSEYNDYCKCMSADFSLQPLLSHIGKDKSIIIWFDEVSKRTDSRKLTFKYAPDNLTDCESQLSELNTLFGGSSYKTSLSQINNSSNEKSGEGYNFYSSAANYKSKAKYLEAFYRYIDESSIGGKSYYLFEIIFWEDRL
jgi:hypothetical protein